MSAAELFRGYTRAWTDGEWISVGAWTARVEMVRPPKRVRREFVPGRVAYFQKRWFEVTGSASTVARPPHHVAYGHSKLSPDDAIVKVAGVYFNAGWWDEFNRLEGRQPTVYLVNRAGDRGSGYAEWPDARICSVQMHPAGWRFGDPR